MFGSSSFGASGFGQNQNQNQNQSQNQNQASAFGSMSGSNPSGSLFGSSLNQNQTQNAFGQPQASSTSIFGQPQNAQPAAPAAPSLFGQQPPQTQSSAFGGFGRPSTTQPASSGSMFGSNTAVSNPFGTQATGVNGAGASTFGGMNQSSSSTFGLAGASTNTLPQGTATFPFEPKSESDAVRPAVTNVYYSISAMPQYENFSFEELRMQDYQQNRRTGNGGSAVAPTASFGTGSSTSTFGQPAQSSGFGFGGQPQAQQPSQFGGTTTTTSAFGQVNNTAPTFGQTSSPFGTQTGSTFGQAKPTTGFGFGTSTPQSTNSGSGLFGNPQQTSSPFGQSNAAPTAFGQTNNSSNTGFGFGLNNNNNSANNNNTAFGSAPKFGLNSGTQAQGTGFGFGAQNQPNQQPSGGLFGQAHAPNQPSGFGLNQPSTGSGSVFGANNQAKPGGLFGQNTQGNSTGFGFGQSNQNSQNNTGGLFGQPSSNQGTGGLFNSSNQTQSGSSLFGQTQNTAQGSQTQQGGLFGQPAAKPGGFFGNPSQSGTGGGLFGAATNTATQPATGSTGFGGSTGIFGNAQNNTAPATGGSLFGGSNTGASSNQTGATSLFGNANTSNTSGGLFGSKPATASTGTGFGFGQSANAQTASGTGLFGTANNANSGATGATGGGLFGGGVAATNGSTLGSASSSGLSGGLFGSQQSTNPATGASLFGNKPALGSQPNSLSFGGSTLSASTGFGTAASNGPRSLVANLGDRNPYGTSPLFDNIGVQSGKPEEFVTALTQPKKGTSSSMLVAHKLAPRPLTVRKLSEKSSRRLSVTTLETPASKPQDHSDQLGPLYSAQTDKIILMSEAFTHRSGDVTLGLSRDKSGSDFTKTKTDFLIGAENGSPPRKPLAPLESSTPFKAVLSGEKGVQTSTPNVSVAGLKPDRVEGKSGEPSNDEEIVNADGYWISPSNDALDRMSLRELKTVRNFRIGRKDIGQIEFKEPVDLSEFADPLTQLANRIVVFAPRIAQLYPDAQDRPPKGEGLNVPARVTLYGIFDKRGLVKRSVDDPAMQARLEKFTKRLKGIENTRFESYEPSTGTWVFSVNAQ